jgi:hypothetical protein
MRNTTTRLLFRLALAAVLTAAISAFALNAPRAQFNGCPAGFCSPQAASAPAGCSAATTYNARTTESTATKGCLTTLICGMIADGNGCSQWSGSSGNLDLLYILAQDNSTDALLNLCSTNFTATENDAPTFTANQGFNSGYLDTNYAPSTNAINFSLNSGSAGLYDRTAPGDSGSQFGLYDGSNLIDIDVNFGGTAFARLNTGTSATGYTAPASNQGQWIISRTSSSANSYYKNGSATPFGTDTNAVGGDPNRRNGLHFSPQ